MLFVIVLKPMRLRERKNAMQSVYTNAVQFYFELCVTEAHALDCVVLIIIDDVVAVIIPAPSYHHTTNFITIVNPSGLMSEARASVSREML